MNEQIRTLAEQAGMNKMNQRSDGLYVVSEQVFEKLAELIVEQCMNIADEYDGVGSTIVSRIKEHFGVE